MGKRSEQTLTKEDMQRADELMKRYSTLCVIRELQIKMTRHYYTPFRTTQIRNTDDTQAGEDAEPQECSLMGGGMQSGAASLGDSLVVSYKMKLTLTIQSSNHAPRCLPE